MKCSGLDPSRGEQVEISFGEAVEAVEPSPVRVEDPPLLAPGFIDLQVNGFAGADFNHPSTPYQEIGRAIRALRACGVTRFLATVITGPFESIAGAFRNLASARRSIPEGESMEGFHLEGPYISPEDGPRGAHPRPWVRPPDLEEFERWQDAAGGLIRVVTLSPEWPGAPRFIESLVSRGVVAAIGHTRATREQIRAAADAGASLSTHLGNAAGELAPLRPNWIWEQLAEDRLAASFIVDGVHLDTAFLKAALRAKGVERSVLVTDAAAPAGCAPGRYRIGELDVVLTGDRRILLADQSRLAASALSMDRAVGNLVELAGLSLREALRMATVNPARAGRIAGRQRGLEPGDRADIVQFRWDAARKEIRIEKTFVAGSAVYAA
jgi:N-acetylglucosamine-6-phosphate deacetylase